MRARGRRERRRQPPVKRDVGDESDERNQSLRYTANGEADHDRQAGHGDSARIDRLVLGWRVWFDRCGVDRRSEARRDWERVFVALAVSEISRH